MKRHLCVRDQGLRPLRPATGLVVAWSVLIVHLSGCVLPEGFTVVRADASADSAAPTDGMKSTLDAGEDSSDSGSVDTASDWALDGVTTDGVSDGSMDASADIETDAADDHAEVPTLDVEMDASDAADAPEGETMTASCLGSGRVACDGVCVNVLADPGHCGRCGNMCPLGQSCVNGTCACLVPGQVVCTGAGCTNPSTDLTNCGGCGVRCAEGQACSAGVCSCPSGLRSCGGVCVDVSGNTANCGACSTSCDALFPNAATACASGRCVQTSCAAGYGDCTSAPGCETRVATDPANCGTCNNACQFAHASATCVAGVCALGACTVDYSNCNGSASDGCEANVRADARNCGMCGNVCPAATGRTAYCQDGVCMLGQICSGTLADCNGVAGDGCEVDTATSPTNCGGCGQACSAAHGTPACAGGRCASILCNTGFGDCDGDLGNGCEADLSASATNCGGCGTRCAFANGIASCLSRVCRLDSCAAGFGDCDANPATGCETSLLTSNTHCGACGHACTGGTTCMAGACQCPAGQQLCGTVCVNVAGNDPNHCGACGVVCGVGMSCVSGACACPAGQTRCGSACIDTATSTTNCGACGMSCDAMLANAVTTCSAGRCGVASCRAGFADCSSAAGCETSTPTDLNHCGICNNRCAFSNASATCAGGVCALGTCTSGYANCNGSASDGCEVNTATDVNNCATCGHACTAPTGRTAFCMGGVCMVGATCATPLADCDGVAVDGCETNTSNDASNCGSCANACNATHGTPTCAGGACTAISCAEGYGNCDGALANGCEVDLRSSVAHCGRCGGACTFAHASATCVTGSCTLGTCDVGFANCNGNAADGCETTLGTSANCGSCGQACSGGTSCVAGACVCPSGQTSCAGACVSTSSDASNCGTCGRACNATHGAPSCSGGACTGIACASGYDNCDGDLTNGCEVDLGSTVTHCGSCSTACAFSNASATCAGRVCGLGTCTSGYANCNGNASDGCEVNTATDANNCATCGHACTAPTGRTAFCRGGVCMVGGVCSTPLADCNGVAGDGCEVNTSSDASNCGSCANACNATHGTPTCAGGACTAISCAAGYGNCDGALANGCEVDLRSSVAHCSACGMSCPARANATASCASSVCGFTCSSGYGDCDGVATNGCEAALATSNTHCGACGHACTGGTTCASGSCVCPSGQTLCSGTCVNVLGSDASNCGACGVACGSGMSCSSGSCVCPSGQTSCSSACVDTATSAGNCGACGASCSGASHSAGGCAASRCTCSAGYADCDSSRSNGCEASLSSDTSCGACGVVCAAGPCVGSTCRTVAEVAGGYDHGCARLSDGSVRCWGDNSHGEIGDGTTTNRLVPTAVTGLSGAATQIATSPNYASCALLSGGALRCWGNNANGQVGDGSMTDRTTAVSVVSTGIAEVSMGYAHTCARTTSGSVACWGNNTYGALGFSGGPANSPSPVTVGISNVAQIALGSQHTCARMSDATVRCWGANASGQLGDGTTAMHTSPTAVPGLTSVAQITAGDSHTCARMSDGTVRCWGANDAGQIGDGTSVNRTAPTSIAGLTGVAQIAAGGNHTCARLTDGSVRCWGRNGYGEVGDNTTVWRNAPVLVSGGYVFASLGLGSFHSCGTLTNGSLRCWGNDAEGQLGDGRTGASSHIPILVVWH